MKASQGDGVPTLVEVEDLKVYYSSELGFLHRVNRTVSHVKAVDGINLVIRRGEILGLVGESGCGKSTLGRTLVRLVEPTEGTVRFDGTDVTSLRKAELRRMRRRMQIIFQDPYESLDRRMRVGSIIAEPLENFGVGDRSERGQRVRELLKLVGLNPDFIDRYPHEFSGGQRQRVGIARALALNPDFVVCDEPVSALDVSIQAQVLNLLVDLRSQLELTYLFIAHDMAVVRHISSRVAVMYLGKLVEVGSPRQVFEASGHPYTRALLSAIPLPNPSAERSRQRIVLSGELPSAENPPPGCRFHTRCWLYERLGQPEKCRVEEPAPVRLGRDHVAACHYPDDARRSRVDPAEGLAAAGS